MDELPNEVNLEKTSLTQLKLQARMALKRTEEIKRILASGVQATKTEGVDEDTAEVIRRLYDPSLSEADLCSCIRILEMLLLSEGLKPLLAVLQSDSYKMDLRERAAHAICVIGAEQVFDQLKSVERSSSFGLRRLAEIALKDRSI